MLCFHPIGNNRGLEGGVDTECFTVVVSDNSGCLQFYAQYEYLN